MFSLFIRMYQAQVKSIGNFTVSSTEKKVFAGMISSSLIILIGYFSDIVYLTLAGSLMLLALSTAFAVVEERAAKKIPSDLLLVQKKQRFDALEQVIKKLSLWDENGISWLDKKCGKAIKEHKKRHSNMKKLIIGDVIVGFRLSFAQEALNIG